MSPGTKEIYLQVGAGTYSGGYYDQGGVPGTNTAINLVSASLTAAQVGSHGSVAMTSNSSVADSFYDGYAVCNPPNQVYIGAWSRNAAGAATLTVTTPANLTSGSSTIPFSQISWTSGANGDSTADIAAGSFNGSSLTLASIANDTWVEDCMTFAYANSAVAAAGVFTGEAVYTLSQP